MYVMPQYEKILKLKEDDKKFADALDTALLVEEKLGNLEADVNNVSDEDMANLNQMLPSEFDQLRIFNDIKGIAELHGVTVGSVDAAEPGQGNAAKNTENKSGYETGTIDLSIEGDYDQFMGFLADIERNLQLLDITGVSLSSQRGDRERGSDIAGDYEFKITLQTYWINI